MNNEKEVLFSVSHLKKYFQVGKNATLKAVDDVSFEIYKGETLGMVRESGCGKTTCGRTCIGLYSRTDGEVLFKGKDPQKLTGKEKQNYKKSVQMVFQDPYGSLDPRMTVAEIIGEGIDIHHLAKNKKERNERIYHYLELVGLNREHANRFVHEFSGGQRQRIGIARTLALRPEFIVCDEPISALDVSIQAQVINLLEKLQREKGFSYLFIAHDLEMVHHISHKIGVMYLGNMVELGSSDDVYKKPLHPYTRALISAAPIADPKMAKEKKRIILEGEVPSPINPPKGCPFAGSTISIITHAQLMQSSLRTRNVRTCFHIFCWKTLRICLIFSGISAIAFLVQPHHQPMRHRETACHLIRIHMTINQLAARCKCNGKNRHYKNSLNDRISPAGSFMAQIPLGVHTSSLPTFYKDRILKKLHCRK